MRKLYVSAMLYGARKRAKGEGIPFELRAADIVIPDRCPVLGIPLRKGNKEFRSDSPSLDRFIPARGYVPSNVEVISLRSNRLKIRRASRSDRREVAERLLSIELETKSGTRYKVREKAVQREMGFC